MDGFERFRASGFRSKSASEIFDKIEPCIGAAVKSRENGVKMRWDLTGFVQPQLTTCPVDKLQILIQRHEETTAISESTRG